MSKEPIFGPGQRPIGKPSVAEPAITNVVRGTARPMLRHVANPDRLQKRCEACCGTGRTDSGDDCYQRCDVCGGEGMLP